MHFYNTENMYLHMNNQINNLDNTYNKYFNINNTFDNSEITNLNRYHLKRKGFFENNFYANKNKNDILIKMGQKSAKIQKNSIYDLNNDIYNNRYKNLNYNTNEVKGFNYNLNNIKILDEEENYNGNIYKNNTIYDLHNYGNIKYGGVNNEYKKLKAENINNNINTYNNNNTRNYSIMKELNYISKNNLNELNNNNNFSLYPYKSNMRYTNDNFDMEKKKLDNFNYLYKNNTTINNNYDISNNITNKINTNLNSNINTLHNNFSQNINKLNGINNNNYLANNSHNFNNSLTNKHNNILNNTKDKYYDIDNIIKKYISKESSDENTKSNYAYANNEALNDILRNSDNSANKNALLSHNISLLKNKQKDEEEKKREKKINLLKNIIVTNTNKKCNISFNDDFYDSMINDNYNLNSSSVVDYNVGNIYNDIINKNYKNNKNQINNIYDESNLIDKLNETPSLMNKQKFKNEIILNDNNNNSNNINSADNIFDNFNYDNTYEKIRNNNMDYIKNKDNNYDFHKNNINMYDNLKSKINNTLGNYQNNIKDYNTHDYYPISNKLPINKNPNRQNFGSIFENKTFNDINDKINNNCIDNLNNNLYDKYNYDINDKINNDLNNNYNDKFSNNIFGNKLNNNVNNNFNSNLNNGYINNINNRYNNSLNTKLSNMNIFDNFNNDKLNLLNEDKNNSNLNENIFKNFNQDNFTIYNRRNSLSKNTYLPYDDFSNFKDDKTFNYMNKNDPIDNIVKNNNINIFRESIKNNENYIGNNYLNKNNDLIEINKIFDKNNSDIKRNNVNTYENIFNINNKNKRFNYDDKIFMNKQEEHNTYDKEFLNLNKMNNLNYDDSVYKKPLSYIEKNSIDKNIFLNNKRAFPYDDDNSKNKNTNLNNLISNTDKNLIYENFNNVFYSKNNSELNLNDAKMNAICFNKKDKDIVDLKHNFNFLNDKNNNFGSHNIINKNTNDTNIYNLKNNEQKDNRIINTLNNLNEKINRNIPSNLNTYMISKKGNEEMLNKDDSFFHKYNRLLNKGENDDPLNKNRTSLNYDINKNDIFENKNIFNNNLNIFNNFNRIENENSNNNLIKYDNDIKENVVGNIEKDINISNVKNLFINSNEQQNKYSNLISSINKTNIKEHTNNLNYNNKYLSNQNNAFNSNINKQVVNKALPPLPFKSTYKPNLNMSQTKLKFYENNKRSNKIDNIDINFNKINDMENNNTYMNHFNISSNYNINNDDTNIYSTNINDFNNFNNIKNKNNINNINKINDFNFNDKMRNKSINYNSFKENLTTLKEKNISNKFWNESPGIFKDNNDLLLRDDIKNANEIKEYSLKNLNKFNNNYSDQYNVNENNQNNKFFYDNTKNKYSNINNNNIFNNAFLNNNNILNTHLNNNVKLEREEENITNKKQNSLNFGILKSNYINSNNDKVISLSNNISMLLEKISDDSDKKNNIDYLQNNYYDLNNMNNDNVLCVNTINYNDNLNIDTSNFVLSDNYLCHFGLSTLYRCKLKNENFSFLINVIDSFYLNSTNGNDTVANNILFHKRLRHLNILSYKGKTADKNKLYLLFENIHGNILKSYSTPFEESIIASYAYQIIDLLEYMHNNFIIFHGLLSHIIIVQKNTREELIQILSEKNKNISKYFDIYKHGIIKVFNFDFANIDANEKDYEFDFFCVAVLIYEMCTKYNTYYSNKTEDIVEKIHNTNFLFPHFVSFELKNFCFELCSKRKHCFNDLKNHPWFKKNFNF
ncbi:protein kinase, putative [Plasmodium gallinaceum]|uniref:Protein kinase, putative n=1 Tax=Plasmodium gallinaceum TaxID=5849 RepID=A0A1J1GPT3_PLAGA|nr:protein kinase, putative [Plasmodium gallinaceum]CRG94429.1 protein kinase, putative [Plasmodium gallinaceum]